MDLKGTYIRYNMENILYLFFSYKMFNIAISCRESLFIHQIIFFVLPHINYIRNLASAYKNDDIYY